MTHREFGEISGAAAYARRALDSCVVTMFISDRPSSAEGFASRLKTILDSNVYLTHRVIQNEGEESCYLVIWSTMEDRREAITRVLTLDQTMSKLFSVPMSASETVLQGI